MNQVDITCPNCTERPRQRVYYHNGHPRCEWCGGQYIAGEWTFLCSKCEKEAEALHGVMVPHLCASCLETEKTRLGTCSRCGQYRVLCTC